jgi:archaellum biogenesis ATPase FlaH
MPYFEGLDYFKGPPTEYIIDSICPKHRVTLLLGREGKGKSKLALAMTHSVVTGQDFLSLDTQQGHVLWYNMDDVFPHDIGDRCYELGGNDKQWAKDVTWYEGDMDILANNPDTGQLFYRDIIDLANQKKSKLIVFDTFSSLLVNSNLNEMVVGETEGLMLKIKRIAKETDTAVLVLHHMPKDIEQVSGRGSTGIGAKADQIFYLDHESSMLHEVTVGVLKSRTHRVQVFPIELNEHGFSLNSDAPTGEPQGAWKGLLSQTKTQSQFTNDLELFTHNFLHTGVRGQNEHEIVAEHRWLMGFMNIPKDRITTVVDHLIKEKKLEKEAHGNNPIYTLWFDDPNEIEKAMRRKQKMKKRLTDD